MAVAREELARQRAAALATRLDGLELPQGAARRKAFEALQAEGLPSRHDEYWRWTDPTPFAAAKAEASADKDAEVSAFDGVEALRAVFVDGVFDAAASDDLTAEGIEIQTLSGAPDVSWASGLYGALARRGQEPAQRPFALLNAAAAPDGLLIRVTGRAAKPLHLVYLRKSDTSDPILHHCVKLDPGAELTILESGAGGARFDCMIEAEIGKGARLHHLRVQGPEHGRTTLTNLFATLAEGAFLKSFTLSLNGRLTRNETVLWLDGDNAVAHVAGATLGDGAEAGGFHHDDTVFITHDALNGESRQVFKKVLENGAEAVFQGKIYVKPGAQKTDGYQISQALLMDDESRFQGKPELEIYADDVKCSHGSTTGALDDTALFYLRSRGVPLEEAKSLLVLSFVADAVDEIEDEGYRDAVTRSMERWLGRHRG